MFVKAGASKHNLYVYDPETTGDTALMPQAGTGNEISHISFCYDTGDPMNPPSNPPSNPPTEPSTTPSGPSSAPSGPSNAPSGLPSSTPDGDVSGVVGTPKLTLPPTDAPPLGATAGSDAPTGSLLAILGALAAASLFALRRPTLRRR